VPLVIARIHQEAERHLEDLGHLMRGKLQRETRAHQTDHGHHGKAGAGDIGIQRTEHADMAAVQSDLFLGLAQSRRDHVRILGIDAAAGETDLPGMVGQMRGALGQDHAFAVFIGHDRHQHGGRIERALAERRHARIELEVAL
jgi:hypothetical protein